jgi:FkbM family methyltransferase
MRAGKFEPEETSVMTRVFSQVDVFVDVGANIGYYTLLARKMGVAVIAVEPQPRNLNNLRRNIAINKWQDAVSIAPVALADQAGSLPLYGASATSASLLKGWCGHSRFAQVVPVSTLDTVACEIPSCTPIAFKIDVEGCELGVLKGGGITLDRFPRSYWMVEVWLDENYPGGTNPDFLAVFETFFSRGFTAHIANAPLTPVTRADVDRWISQGHADHGKWNYLFVGPDAALNER